MSGGNDDGTCLGGEELWVILFVSEETDVISRGRIQSGHSGKTRTRLTAYDGPIDEAGEFEET